MSITQGELSQQAMTRVAVAHMFFFPVHAMLVCVVRAPVVSLWVRAQAG